MPLRWSLRLHSTREILIKCCFVDKWEWAWHAVCACVRASVYFVCFYMFRNIKSHFEWNDTQHKNGHEHITHTSSPIQSACVDQWPTIAAIQRSYKWKSAEQTMINFNFKIFLWMDSIFVGGVLELSAECLPHVYASNIIIITDYSINFTRTAAAHRALWRLTLYQQANELCIENHYLFDGRRRARTTEGMLFVHKHIQCSPAQKLILDKRQHTAACTYGWLTMIRLICFYNFYYNKL